VNSHSPVTILPLLAEMARCPNQNLVELNLAALAPAFSTSGDSETGATPKQTSNV